MPAHRLTQPVTLNPLRRGRRNRVSLAQQFAVRILAGEFAEGYVFPGEVDLAAKMGISRSALREAFRVLASKGLLESRPKTGTRVTSRRQWSLLDPDLLAWQFEAEPSRKFLRDLFELRLIVEPGAAALAAQRRSAAQVAQMKAALKQMGEHGLATEQGRQADQQFHLTMLDATGNEAVLALASSIMAAIAWTTIYKQRKRKLPRDPMPEHLALCKAIEKGDPDEARDAMAELVRLALADTEIALRKQR